MNKKILKFNKFKVKLMYKSIFIPHINKFLEIIKSPKFHIALAFNHMDEIWHRKVQKCIDPSA